MSRHTFAFSRSLLVPTASQPPRADTSSYLFRALACDESNARLNGQLTTDWERKERERNYSRIGRDLGLGEGDSAQPVPQWLSSSW